MLFACWFLSHTQSTPGISDSASVEGGSVAVPDAFLCRFLSHTQGTPGILNSASVEGGRPYAFFVSVSFSHTGHARHLEQCQRGGRQLARSPQVSLTR